MASTKKIYSIVEAAKIARQRGLIGDYYELHLHQQHGLVALMQTTRWRPSRSALAKGWSWAYAFHQALKRQKDFDYIHADREKADRLFRHAAALASQAVRNKVANSGGNRISRTKLLAQHKEARSALLVAKDAYLELDDTKTVSQIEDRLRDINRVIRNAQGHRKVNPSRWEDGHFIGRVRRLPRPTSRDRRRTRR